MPKYTIAIIILLLTLTIGCLMVATAYAEPLPVKFITIEEYKANIDQTTLLDVRSTGSREKSNMGATGAIWIDPYSGQALDVFVAYADKNTPYVVFCSCIDDNFSIRAAQLLMKNGFKDVSVLKGGWDSIVNNGVNISPLY